MEMSSRDGRTSAAGTVSGALKITIAESSVGSICGIDSVVTSLLFITLRLMKGHFTPQRHFGFEGAAWYWHFVDVVWLGLYVVVYWL